MLPGNSLAGNNSNQFTLYDRASAIGNQGFCFSTWLGDWHCGAAPRFRRGPVKYRFRTLYELDSLAVVNVRDAGNCKNAFKLLMFPDTKMFQAENPKAKVSPSSLLSPLSSLLSPALFSPLFSPLPYTPLPSSLLLSSLLSSPILDSPLPYYL